MFSDVMVKEVKDMEDVLKERLVDTIVVVVIDVS